MFTIDELIAWEILDSRGRPTVKAGCRLRSGAFATASVPSGASTGRAEASELRDGDPHRYRGLGCRKAVANVRGEISKSLSGVSFANQEELDSRLIALDGTPDKSRLGANAILGASLAFARAAARQERIELFEFFGRLAPSAPSGLPRPAINLFSGGKHAGGQVAIQDVLIVPMSPSTMDECLSMASEVYLCAAEATASRYGTRALVADEGGLAPDFGSAEEMIEMAVAAIERAGLVPGKNVSLAIDVASSHFFAEGVYSLDGASLDGDAMVAKLVEWTSRYPVVSIEDGLAEEEWGTWPMLRERLSGRAWTLGDDFLCTNPERIRRSMTESASDALLLKVNQIGTLTEAAKALRLAREAGWAVVVSARSGETEDGWLADLAVGWSGDQIKIGSITRSERLAKYNRLLEIEALTGWGVA